MMIECKCDERIYHLIADAVEISGFVIGCLKIESATYD